MSNLDLSEALAGEGARVATGRLCKFGVLLAAVPPEQAAELDARLRGGQWTDDALARLISGTAFGHINASVLSRHRNAMCVCDTPTENEAA